MKTMIARTTTGKSYRLRNQERGKEANEEPKANGAPGKSKPAGADGASAPKPATKEGDAHSSK
jgi:hypothetical protein